MHPASNVASAFVLTASLCAPASAMLASDSSPPLTAAQFGVLGLLAALKRQEMASSQYPATGDDREPEIAE